MDRTYSAGIKASLRTLNTRLNQILLDLLLVKEDLENIISLVNAEPDEKTRYRIDNGNDN